jgi:hypothetical protein
MSRSTSLETAITLMNIEVVSDYFEGEIGHLVVQYHTRTTKRCTMTFSATSYNDGYWSLWKGGGADLKHSEKSI